MALQAIAFYLLAAVTLGKRLFARNKPEPA